MKAHQTLYPLAFVAAELSFVATARAQDSDVSRDSPPAPPRFGSRGQVVLDELVGLQASSVPAGSAGSIVGMTGTVSYASTPNRSASGDITTLTVQPSVDVFVAERWSIGGAAAVSRRVQRGEGSLDEITTTG